MPKHPPTPVVTTLVRFEPTAKGLLLAILAIAIAAIALRLLPVVLAIVVTLFLVGTLSPAVEWLELVGDFKNAGREWQLKRRAGADARARLHRQGARKGHPYVEAVEDDLLVHMTDAVLGLQFEQDAHAMRTAMAERLAKFGLELHPEKTRSPAGTTHVGT
jgi:hypothetical protein